MQRKVIYRGLRHDGCGWVHGDLKRENDNRFGGQFWYIWVDTDDVEDEGEYVRVNWESVSQFTGLTDKNGIYIYEGDIDDSDRVMLWSEDMTLFCWHYWNEFRQQYFPSSYPCYKNESHKVTIICNIYEKK